VSDIVTIAVTAIAVSVIATLIIADLKSSITWIAERIVSRAAQKFDVRNRLTKDEEYRANVQHAEGLLSVLMYAIFTYIKAPYRARELREQAPGPEMFAVEVGPQRHAPDRVPWQLDIDQSVAEYNRWYLAESATIFAQARERVVTEVVQAMRVTNDFQTLDADALAAWPRVLLVARTSVSPPMTRDRFVALCGVDRGLVAAMEGSGTIPNTAQSLRTQLQTMCIFLRPLLGRGVFSWLEHDRAPTAGERDRAIMVISERLASTLYLPAFRSAQATRQKDLMRAYLESKGFRESFEPPFGMPAGSYGFDRQIEAIRESGDLRRLLLDCVVAPLDIRLPLVCIEQMSAGNSANVIKRRSEGPSKHSALKRAHGDRVLLLLQLFGHFNNTYLRFEAEAGIGWVWDHRLSDLGPYCGV
jgi:hypothetical protein